MRRLNGIDAMLLYSETPNLHTHTLKVLVLHRADRGVVTFESVHETLENRLSVLDPLRYKLVEMPWKLHHPMWCEMSRVNLGEHLHRVQVASPGGRRELDRLIGEIASRPLDRSKPLWEFYFVEGMLDGRYALIGKVHHALADGVASSNLLARAIGVSQPSGACGASGVGVRLPTRGLLVREAMRDHLRQVAELPGVVRASTQGLIRARRQNRVRGKHPDMATLFKPPLTFLNHVVSPIRTFASAAVSLAEVKEAARELRVTFNDIVLATATGALRELLLRYDGRADRPLLSSVPVSTDRSPNRLSGNEIGGLAVSLPVHVEDPLQRVRLISLSTAMAKEDLATVGAQIYGRWMNYLPTAVAPVIYRWQAGRADRNSMMNVPVSSVAGPHLRGEIAGAPVTEIYSTGVLSPGVGINLTVWSYADQMNIAVLTDDRTFGDVHEVTDAILHSFAELRQAAGFPADLSTLESAMPAAKVVS